MQALKLKIPPVVQFIVAAFGMWLIAKFTPALAIDIPARQVLVVVFICLGGTLAIPAVATFRAVGTTVAPRRPEEASRLVTTGVYRYSRNPMYLGLLSLLIAWALYLANMAGFAALPLFVVSMNYLQIHLEEQAMEAQFGGEYRDYRKSVRRWI